MPELPQKLAVAEILEHEGARLIRTLLGERTFTLDRSMAAPAVGSVVTASIQGDRAVAVQLLAEPGAFRSAMYRLAASFGIDPLHPPEAVAEAAGWVEKPGLSDPDLENLEDVPFVTIDNEDSRDLDQALWIGRGGDGYHLLYALADASFYVRPGSALFAGALDRGASFYLPGLSLPMLPPSLSEGLISLNPGVLRRALVMDIRLDERGLVRTARIRRARIRSRRKLSYARVQRSWDDPSGSGFGGEAFEDSLRALRDLGRRRIADARRRHVVAYNRVELAVEADGAGGVTPTARERREVDRCNEQISLLCNIEGARLLERHRGADHVQPIFRVHPEPTPERLADFSRTLEALARAHALPADRWVWRSGDVPLADFLDQLPRRGWPRLAAAIEHQAVLTNVRSTFGPEPGAHHGIGAPVYARFSSPMREIVGVFTHKEALEALAGGDAAAPSAEDEALRDLVVESANRAKSIQKSLTRAAHLEVLRRTCAPQLERPADRRPWFRGTLLGMKPTVLYVRLDDPPLEVKVHLRDLRRETGQRWRPDPSRVLVVGPRRGSRRTVVRMGDAVDLRLVGHRAAQSRFVFEIRPAGPATPDAGSRS